MFQPNHNSKNFIFIISFLFRSILKPSRDLKNDSGIQDFMTEPVGIKKKLKEKHDKKRTHIFYRCA